MYNNSSISNTTNSNQGLQESIVPPGVMQTLKQEQQRRQELEQYILWEDSLFRNPNIGPARKLEIRATRRAFQRSKTRDDAGRARINLKTIGEEIGESPDTVARGLKVLAACGIIPDKELDRKS